MYKLTQVVTHQQKTDERTSWYFLEGQVREAGFGGLVKVLDRMRSQIV